MSTKRTIGTPPASAYGPPSGMGRPATGAGSPMQADAARDLSIPSVLRPRPSPTPPVRSITLDEEMFLNISRGCRG